MSVLREWLRRLWGTFRKAPHDHDGEMEEELRLHVDMITDELKRRGLSSEDAACQARLQAGGIAQAMEQRRDQRGLRWLEDLIQDLRYGVRTLRRAPVFTAVTIATLTLAIGANTAAFSLVDPLLFRGLPVRDPGSLVQFTYRYPGDPPLNVFSLEDYAQYRDRSTVFSDMVGLAPLRTESSAGREPIGAWVVTGNFFHALGVRPALGRVLDVSDDTPGGAPIAIVSWRYWQAQFGEERALGAIVDINDRRLPGPVHATVVGVAEPEFSGVTVSMRQDVWVSLGAIPTAMRSRAGVGLLARLKPGASIAQARAEMRVLDQSRIDGLAQRDPQWRHVAIDVTSARAGLSTPLTDQFGGPLSLLMAIVGILLLLAGANIGGLLLARGAARQHEMAVRVSLGAGRLRMVRQVLTESLLLASIGGALGLVGARFGATILMRIMTSGTQSLGPPSRLEIPLDARVLLFTIGVTMLAALVFGLAPAIAAFVSAPASALRQGGGSQTKSRRVFGNGLVVAQVALSLALVSVGQLYIAHLGALRDQSLGFDRRGVLLVSVNASAGARSREAASVRYDEALMRLRALPGVRSVAASAMIPLSGAAGSRFARVAGYEEPQAHKRRCSLNSVSPGYFATYGTPILAGRDFRDSDAHAPRLVIVNQTMALRYFAGRDPIGQPVWLEGDPDPFEIIGLADDAKYQDPRIAAPPTIYLYAPVFAGSMELSLRAAVALSAVATEARRVLADVFGSGAVGRVTTLEEHVDASIVPERLIATLAGFFAMVGTALAAIGLYGLIAYSVTRRTHEFSIRMALGATRSSVLHMILRDALRLVAIGLVVGAPLAVWGKGVAATVLEGLASGGVTPIVLSAAGMIVVALIAALVPARRATRIEPVSALRAE
jgi:predicted permease